MAIVPVAVFDGMSEDDNSFVSQTAHILQSHANKKIQWVLQRSDDATPSAGLHDISDLNISLENKTNCLVH